jgi:hypothetical protein
VTFERSAEPDSRTDARRGLTRRGLLLGASAATLIPLLGEEVLLPATGAVAATPGVGSVEYVYPVGPKFTGSSVTNPYASGHKATDFVASEGTAVRAIADGVVTMIPSSQDFYDGWRIEMRHADGAHSGYCHLPAGAGGGPPDTVHEGDFVPRGQTIAYSGRSGHNNAGDVVGPHLHLGMSFTPGDAISSSGAKSNTNFNAVPYINARTGGLPLPTAIASSNTDSQVVTTSWGFLKVNDAVTAICYPYNVFQATLSFTMSGLAAGERLFVRFVKTDTSGTVLTTFSEIIEFDGSSNPTAYGQASVAARVADDERIRAQASMNTASATVTRVTVRGLGWSDD